MSLRQVQLSMETGSGMIYLQMVDLLTKFSSDDLK
eukprot:SAG31_NODE_194_length_20722_cov_19.854192_10_plen_35_part_00